MKTETLHRLLTEVRWYGSIRIHKRELLWMLGRVNDHPSAWGILLDEWTEIGNYADDLYGHEWGDFITLLYKESVAVSDWTGR